MTGGPAFEPGQRVGVIVPGAQGLRQGVVRKVGERAIEVHFDDGARGARRPDELVAMPAFNLPGGPA